LESFWAVVNPPNPAPTITTLIDLIMTAYWGIGESKWPRVCIINVGKSYLLELIKDISR
jgi:hypothetical protein